MPDGLFKYKKGGAPAWGVRLKFQDDAGTWRAKTWRGFASQADAREFRDRQRAERYRVKYFPDRPQTHTVRDYFEHWLNTYARAACKFSTYVSYARVLNKYLLPTLGHRQLSSLTTTDCKTLLAALTGKKRQTIRNIFCPIREGLRHAVAEGLIAQNPMDALAPHLKQLKAARRHVTPLTDAQIADLLARAQATDPMLHAAILLGVRAGLRRGEILGLRWADLSLTEHTASIRHATVYGAETTPKNHQLRVVDLAPSVVATLTCLPRTDPHGRVITRNGRGPSAAWLNKAFVALAHGLRFHDLRHTCASHLIAIGAHPKYIQAQLGHSTIAVTFDVYGHLFKNERFMDRLDHTPDHSSSPTTQRRTEGI